MISPQSSNVEYVSMGALTRDSQIASNGDLMFGADPWGELGGGCAYTMAGVRVWDKCVGLVGRITDGIPQEWMGKLAQAADVDTRGLRRAPGVPTELIFSRFAQDGSRTEYDPRQLFPPYGKPVTSEIRAWRELSRADRIEMIRRGSPGPEDIPEDYLQARAFHVSPNPVPTQLRVAEYLHPHHLLIVADHPGPLLNGIKQSELEPLLASVDVFMPSEGEVRGYFGATADLRECARRYTDLGPGIVVIKQGARGSLVYDRGRDRIWDIPIYPAQTRDPTGAGDSYCGGFMVGYVETGDALQAGLYGTVSASFVVEGPGALYALQFHRTDAERRLGWVREHLA